MWRAGWKAIAELGGLDKNAHIYFEGLLRNHDIQCAIEGSKVYHVFVPSEAAESAIRLLHSDAKWCNHSIKIISSIDNDDYVEYGDKIPLQNRR